MRRHTHLIPMNLLRIDKMGRVKYHNVYLRSVGAKRQTHSIFEVSCKTSVLAHCYFLYNRYNLKKNTIYSSIDKYSHALHCITLSPSSSYSMYALQFSDIMESTNRSWDTNKGFGKTEDYGWLVWRISDNTLFGKWRMKTTDLSEICGVKTKE